MEEETSFEKIHFGTKLFELAYESRYKPQWLWLRGRSKRDWVERVCETYKWRAPPGQAGADIPDEDMAALKRATHLSFMSWIVVLGMTFLLMVRRLHCTSGHETCLDLSKLTSRI